MDLIISVLLILGLAIIFSSYDIHFSEKGLYVDNANSKVIYRAVGKGISTRSYERLPMMRLTRVSKYMFKEEGLVGAKYVWDEVTPMTESFFDEGRGIV